MKTPSSQPSETAKTADTAVAKPAPPLPTEKMVKDLAAMLDGMHAEAEAMLKLHEQLGEATRDSSRRLIIQQAEKVLEHFEKTGGKGCFKSGRLQKIWTECHPESWWSKDGGVPAYSQVAKMVTILMGSFPTSKIPEPEIFVRVLLNDLMELSPSFVEMESTCRQLRKKNKFMPSISEVVEALKKQKKLWGRRSTTMEVIQELYDDLCAKVAQAKAADEREDGPRDSQMPNAVEVEDDGRGQTSAGCRRNM